MKINGLKVVFQNDEGAVSGPISENKSSDNSPHAEEFESISDLFNIEEPKVEDNPKIPSEDSSSEDPENATESSDNSNNNQDSQEGSTEVTTEPAETSQEDPPSQDQNTEPVTDNSAEVIANLQNQVATLTTQLTQLISQTQTQGQPTGQEKPEPEIPSKVLPEVDLSSLEDDFEGALESKEGFMKFLSKAMTLAQSQTVEKVYESIPNVVGNFIQRQSVMRDAAAKFYSDHPELKRVKRYVGQVATEVSSEHPEWDISQVFDETARRAKAALNLENVVNQNTMTAATTQPAPQPTAPVLPGGSTGTTRTGGKVSIDKLQSEIDELLD